MTTESGTIPVLRSGQIVQHSPSLQQGEELSSQFSFKNTIRLLSELSISPSEPQNRRKRRRTSEQHSFQQLVGANQINLGLSDKNPSSLSWPQNFTFQSSGVNKSVRGLESKPSFFSVKNHRQLPRKSPFGIQRNLSNAGLFAFHGNNVGSEKVDNEKSVDFSKEIEDAISRIESLIPSLQKLVKPVDPPKEKNVGKLGLPNISSSVNPTGKGKYQVITTNEQGLTDKLAAPSENAGSKQANLLPTKCNLPAPLRVKWSRNVECVPDDDMRKQIPYPKEAGDKSLDWLVQNEGRMRNLKLENNSDAGISQVPMPKGKAIMGRPESLKYTPSRNASFASRNLEQIEGLRIMPQQSCREEAIDKDEKSRRCTQVPSVASTSYRRPNRTSTTNVGTSDQKGSQSHTSERISQEGLPSAMIKSRDSFNGNSVMRKNRPLPHDQISEETSCSSCTASSATTQQSGSLSSSGGTYLSSETDYSDSDESEPRHEKVGRSARRKQPEVTESTTSDYDDDVDDDDGDTSSSCKSQDEYSDIGPSSRKSSVRYHKWDQQKERGKRRGGRLKRLGKKLGMIFHHHHHHHHHHYDNEPDAHRARSLWKRIGGMFHHTKKTDDHQKSKVEKPRKPKTKAVVKSKQGGANFHALVGGLVKHMKHSRKTKQVKNGIKGIGNGHHGGTNARKKLPWWPKTNKGRGGLKVANKGKVKFGNYRSKSMAAAKFILGK